MNEPLNLVPAIKELEKQKNELTAEFHRKIQPLENSIKHLKELNEACEWCEGRGWELRKRVCAEDNRPDPNCPQDRLTCLYCGGTGKKVNKKAANDLNTSTF